MHQALTAADAMVCDAPPFGSGGGLVTVRDAGKDAEVATDARRAAWMAAAQAGDRAAYEQVLAESVSLIRAVARRRGVPHDHLDDVVQDTLVTLHRIRHTYDPARSYNAWLSAIAAHRALDMLRSRGRRARRELHDALPEGTPQAADASAQAEQSQQAQRLRAAIAELPPRQREAVEHIGLQGHTLGEAADITGRSTGALKVNLHRAIKALRGRLKGGV
jgi:RNA polymerase sigma factor (sigma-70 family)